MSYVNTLSDSAISFATLHSRLGHPNADTIKIISKLCNIPIINKTGSDFCSHCCVGKSHHLWMIMFAHVAFSNEISFFFNTPACNPFVCR